MNSRERAGHRLSAALLRSPLAVTPEHVLSPMDTQRTVSISRSLIDDCLRSISGAAERPRPPSTTG